jgi:hypothetical protein
METSTDFPLSGVDAPARTMTGERYRRDIVLQELETFTQTAVMESLFTFPDAVDSYLADVRARRLRRRIERQKQKRLQDAITKIEQEHAEAQADEDIEIASELEALLREFRMRLSSLQEGAPTQIQEPAPPREEVSAPPPEPEPSAPAPESPALTDEERLALVEQMTQKLQEIEGSWVALGDKADANHLPQTRQHGFFLRALFCMLGAVYAEAREMSVLNDLEERIDDLRDRILMARFYAGDQDASLPFEKSCRSSNDGCLTSMEWEELADRYAAAADVQEKWQWYLTHREKLEPSTRQSLLNTLIAGQQRLYRTLEKHNGHDKLQSDLYQEMREAATSIGLMASLSPNIGDARLECYDAKRQEEWEKAVKEWDRAVETEEKVARKTAAIKAVQAWGERFSEQMIPAESFVGMQSELFGLLDECMAAAVPPTNVTVRKALLEHAPTLLKGESRYAKFLEAVLAERKRLGLDPDSTEEEENEEEEPSDSELQEYIARVAEFASGKRLLILGGVPRQRTCEEMQQMLGFSEVQWLASKKSDRVNKFKSEIMKADILIVVKNFAGHDISEKGREWTRESGGHFLLLRSGYGVKQIVYHLYQYIEQRKSHSEPAAAI